MLSNKFTINDFNKKYPDDDACIAEIFNKKFGSLKECPECKKPFKYYKVNNRKCYACQFCANQIYPLANTIFHKSDTPIRLWFYAIFLFSASKNGVSAKELERQLGVTYKTAWRIAKQIRMLFEENGKQLDNTAEADETYIGGKKRGGKRGRGAENKTPVIGIVEKQGSVIAQVTQHTKSSVIKPFIKNHLKIGANLMTDEYKSYGTMTEYNHQKVNHGARQWVNGLAYTNTIEGFWSQLKRSIDGTYHAVSPKYLQQYVNEFAWRYNNRFYKSVFHFLVANI